MNVLKKKRSFIYEVYHEINTKAVKKMNSYNFTSIA